MRHSKTIKENKEAETEEENQAERIRKKVKITDASNSISILHKRILTLPKKPLYEFRIPQGCCHTYSEMPLSETYVIEITLIVCRSRLFVFKPSCHITSSTIAPGETN